jgi:hypothetical protein
MSVMITAILAILLLGVALLLWAEEIVRDRKLVCEIVPKLLYTRRTWKLRITSESTSVKTLGEVVVWGRIATSVHAEHALVNVGSIMLATGQRAEFDLGPPLVELLEKLGRPGQGDASVVLDATIDIHHLVKSRGENAQYVSLPFATTVAW